MILKPRISKRWDKSIMAWKYHLQVEVQMVVEALVMETSEGRAEQYTAQAMVRQLQQAVATMQERDWVIVVEDNAYVEPNKAYYGLPRDPEPLTRWR